MAYKNFDDFSVQNSAHNKGADHNDTMHISMQSGADHIDLPDASFVRDADMTRDGGNLILHTPNGQTIVIEGYFTAAHVPNLVAPDGSTLTPDMVNHFAKSPSVYADASTGALNDSSPVGIVQEIKGHATVTRTDGTEHALSVGSPIFQGDIIETDHDGAVNITFVDETTFAVSEDARLSIDEYVFDPATQSGTNDFSVLKGVFVFTSGLIGRDDPDDVHIHTPNGSIGIRGTIIAGDVNKGEITVVEGAIVLKDFGGHEITLASQYDTAKFGGSEDGGILHMGTLSASDVSTKFYSVSSVSGDLFSSINDSAHDAAQPQQNAAPDAPHEATPQQPADHPHDAVAPHPATASDGTTAVAPPPPPPTGDGSALLDGGHNLLGTTNPFQTTTSGTGGTLLGTTTTATSGTTTSATSGTTTTVATGDPLVKPPFDIDIHLNNLGNENSVVAANTVVATISAVNADHMAMKLLGISDGFYDLVRLDATHFNVVTAQAITYDYEHFKDFRVAAIDDYGHTVEHTYNALVNNVDEGIVAHPSEPSAYFIVNESGSWDHFFDLDYSDPDGQKITYSYTLGSGAESYIKDGAAGIHFDADTGHLSFTALDDFTGSSDFSLSITATTIDPISHSVDTKTDAYTFTFKDHDGTSVLDTGDLTSTGDTFNTGSIESFKSIFLTDGNDKIIATNTTNSGFYLGDGNDKIDLGGTSMYGNAIVAGQGDDTVTINSTAGWQNNIYLGDNTDHLNFMAYNSFSNAIGNTGFVFDGGHDDFKLSNIAAGDELYINTADTTLSLDVNFTVLLGAYPAGIKNFEIVNVKNGQSAGNTVTLSYNDVINITDDRNTLVLKGDSNDHVAFNNNGHDFVKAGTTTQGGETYNIFSDGHVTLLVDQNMAVNHDATGLPA